MKRYRILIVFCIFFSSCVKPYEFDAQSYEKVLVIDGLVTNSPGPQQVKISYTYPLDTTLTSLVTGAEVWVEDGGGSRIEYSESEEGVYLSPEGFSGKAGETYQLFIITSDGKTYQSDEERLYPSPPLDSIYDKYAVLPTTDGDRNVGGIQFFIDSHNGPEGAKHFRYEWDETYKIVVPFPATHKVVDTMLVPLDTPTGICYQTNYSTSIITGSTIDSEENRMAEFPVRFVSQEEQMLRFRYSILVRQYAISEDAFLFYKRLRENNESGGSLFDQQTGTILGNIRSLDEPDEPVLGFFEVAGVSEKRAFFNFGDFDDRLEQSRYIIACLEEEAMRVPLPEVVDFYKFNSTWHVYRIDYPTDPEGTPTARLHTRGCTTCTWYASNVKPDFWID